MKPATLLSPRELATYMDSTNLQLNASLAELKQLCKEARDWNCAAVCLYPSDVTLAAELLRDSPVRIATVVGFPSGRFSLMAKEAEIAESARAGAHEVDIVMNYADLLAGKTTRVEEELKVLVANAQSHGLLSKIIVETCFLQECHLLQVLELCESAGADFIKTSTGFGTGGATEEHIRLWARNRHRIRIKASGGIRQLSDAIRMIDAGADRLGLSSAASILTELSSGTATQPNGNTY
jgi:deoxyribose-phosphate aldolase